MTTDLAAKSEKDLANFIENYRRKGQTTSDAYRSLLRELELKRGKGLDLDKTLECVIAAARDRRFVSYKQVADINDMPMAKARLLLTRHLKELCEYATSQGLPLLSAIVVNTEGVATGTMNAASRSGFIKAARDLGSVIQDEVDFVKAEQAKIFERYAPGAHP